MTTRFQTALEARAIAHDVLQQLRECGSHPDLMRYYRNVDKMISELGALEVQARQTHNYRRVKDYIPKIEEALDYLEKMILIYKITG